MEYGVEAVRVRMLPDRRVTAKDGGKVLGRTQKTMAEWRCRGWGPKPIKVGGRIFYDYDECLGMSRVDIQTKPDVGLADGCA